MGYPSALINHELDRVKGMARGNLLEGMGKKEKRGVPFVVTYSRHLPNINKILEEKKYLLARSEKLKSILTDDVFVSYKRGTNLKDLLVHKKTRQLDCVDSKTQGECGKICAVCRFMYKGQDRITGPGGKRSCTYDRTIGCKSRNVIYGIFAKPVGTLFMWVRQGVYFTNEFRIIYQLYAVGELKWKLQLISLGRVIIYQTPDL